MDIFVVILLATFATLMVRRRRPKELPAAPPEFVSDPERRLIEALKRLGFISSPVALGAACWSRAKHDDVLFHLAPQHFSCKACGVPVFRLERFVTDPYRRTRTFGAICANCQHLATTDAAEVPERIRHAWASSTEFPDFYDRMTRGPAAEPESEAEEPLAARKARLERELAEVEGRRNELRSELLSVKNRLDEPDDGPPHR